MTGYVEGDDDLLKVLVGRKIVSVADDVITLDDGTTAALEGYGDCCAFAQVEALLLHPDKVDHAITSVRVDEQGEGGTAVEVWHFMADMADVLDVTIGYSEGTGYYSFGIDVKVAR